jgi:hypothetical protein
MDTTCGKTVGETNWWADGLVGARKRGGTDGWMDMWLDDWKEIWVFRRTDAQTVGWTVGRSSA